MCKCNPQIRTPYCGKQGCEAPLQKHHISSIELEKLMHIAVCQAVALMNCSTTVPVCQYSRQAHEILRKSLADYADAYMNQPVSDEQNLIRTAH